MNNPIEIAVQNMHLSLRFEPPALSPAAWKEAQLEAAKQLSIIFSNSQSSDGRSLSKGDNNAL